LFISLAPAVSAQTDTGSVRGTVYPNPEAREGQIATKTFLAKKSHKKTIDSSVGILNNVRPQGVRSCHRLGFHPANLLGVVGF